MDIRVLEKNVKNPEGPVSLPDGTWVFTEMDIGAITHMTADGHRRCIAATGLPNGLAVSADGRIWVTEAKQRALLAVSLKLFLPVERNLFSCLTTCVSDRME